jgi:hypothetical protein
MGDALKARRGRGPATIVVQVYDALGVLMFVTEPVQVNIAPG